MPRRRTARIAFARIELLQSDQLHFDPTAALLQSLEPGARVVRYDRDWRMGRYERHGHFINGRIGYQMSGSAVELWDDDARDFRRTVLTEGYTSPFAIDIDELRVAFQLRSGFIKPTTFTSNFRALLEQASGAFAWNVAHEVRSISWEEWRQSVSRITEVSVRLDRPNPNYHGRRKVREVIEGAGAKMVRLIYRADPEGDQGINVNAALLAEALEHAEEDGSFEAKGELVTEGWVEPTQWREDVEGSPIQKKVRIDPETGEALPEDLRDSLGGQPAE